MPQLGQPIARALLVPAIVGGAVATVIIAASFAATGNFVFEGPPTAGAPEQVSPYFGGVVGAVVTAGLIGALRAAGALRDATHIGRATDPRAWQHE